MKWWLELELRISIAPSLSLFDGVAILSNDWTGNHMPGGNHLHTQNQKQKR